MEVRIAGVNLPINKHVIIALTAIFGIGKTRAEKICAGAAVNSTTKVMKLDEGQIEKLRGMVARYTIEGELRREVAFNIKRKIDINCYEGIRHKRGLPLRQRTKTNARTRKGKRKPVRK